MLDNLLRAANLYHTGLEKVKERRDQWLHKYVELRDHLKAAADYLNSNALYKQVFFVDTLHAFNEEINGTCAKMPSVTFRSGEMPMLVTFKNSLGEKKSFEEEGFHISFNPTLTGQVVVMLQPHQSTLNKEPAPYTTLAVINDLSLLTMEVADEMIARGIETAFHTSFTGMSEQPTAGDIPPPPAITERNPIGFKRYETTEKVK